MRKKLSLFLLALITGAGTMFASDTQVGGIWYNFNSSTRTASVTYRGSSFTSFSNRYSGSVVIPSSVTYYNITYSVTSIGSDAFYGCSGLTSVVIPNSVTSIGSNAFYGCSGLTSPVYNAHVFAYMPTSYSGAYTLPNGIESIADFAFYGCTGLTSVTIPNSVTSIGVCAFRLCEVLTSIEIPDSVTSIGSQAFTGCYALTSITIPSSVTSIGSDAFYKCTGLTSVTWNAKNCNNNIYNFGSQVKTFTFGNEVEVIPASLCSGMSLLTTITIPKSVTSIGSNAFDGCSGLTSIEIPNSVTSIGSNAFNNCNNLTTLSLGENITSYGKNAFAHCPNLTSIYNYRERPAKLGTGTFDGVDYFNCTLYVLAGSVNMYKSPGSDWKDFYFVESIGAETVITENVVVTPNDNTANFVWPSSATADSYTLDIVKNGELICTLHFNANGQLTSIAFNAPARNGNSAPQQTNEQVAGFSFTVTGLDAATKYGYTLTAKDNSGNVVETYTGTFATEGYVASQYTITFVNYDGTELQSSQIAEDEMPVYTGATPTRPEDEQYTYTFTGWTPEISAVSEDATYTATFEAVAKQQYYTITFVNYDGTELQSSEVAEGETPVYNGATPTKPEDEQYTYTFTGWTPEISAVSGDATYTASYAATPKSQGIDNVQRDDVQCTKVLRDGQIFILRGGKVYDMTGQEVR